MEWVGITDRNKAQNKHVSPGKRPQRGEIPGGREGRRDQEITSEMGPDLGTMRGQCEATWGQYPAVRSYRQSELCR